MMVDLLDAARNVTPEQAIGIAFSPQVWHAELWQERIRKAAPQSEFGKILVSWDRRSDANSRPALAYYLFKMALGTNARAVDPPASLTDEAVRAAIDTAEQRLKSEFAPEATYGTLFRVGRQNGKQTWPVSGGSVAEAGMATPRAIGFKKSGNEMVGQSGQTQTQIIILTKPPQSYMVIPLGESDHPDSGHFDDQAEKLFSKSQAKPTYFLNRKDLEKHVTMRKELTF
jgi:acyl-homoserine lactone acylase PvdQ